MLDVNWIGYFVLRWFCRSKKRNQFKCKIQTNVLGIHLIPVRDVLIILLSQFKLFNIREEERAKEKKTDVETIDTRICTTDQIKMLSGAICAISIRSCKLRAWNVGTAWNGFGLIYCCVRLVS